jgi:hypothetical protein
LAWWFLLGWWVVVRRYARGSGPSTGDQQPGQPTTRCGGYRAQMDTPLLLYPK